MNPPFKEWADVVKDGAAALLAIKAEMRPASQSPRKRRRINLPKPVFPRMSRKAKKPKIPPRWAQLGPRLPCAKMVMPYKQTEPPPLGQAGGSSKP